MGSASLLFAKSKMNTVKQYQGSGIKVIATWNVPNALGTFQVAITLMPLP